jgi:hypothetical protein
MAKFQCTECGNKYKKKFAQCPNCEASLKPTTNHQSVKGDGNQTVQVGGDNKGDIIFQHSETQDIPVTTHYRERIKPIMFGKLQAKLNWLSMGGGLGVAVALITFVNQIITFFNSFGSGATSPSIQSVSNTMFLSYLLLAVSAFIIIAYWIIRRFNHLNVLGRTIQAGNDGYLFFTKIVGTCGVCGNLVKLSKLGNESALVCTKNHNHSVAFDWTVLDDISEEYQRLNS